MSKWLQSVNNLLEKLDDHGAVEASVVPQRTAAAAAAARRFLSSTVAQSDDDEESGDDGDYESYDDDDEYEEDYVEDQEEEEDEVDFVSQDSNDAPDPGEDSVYSAGLLAVERGHHHHDDAVLVEVESQQESMQGRVSESPSRSEPALSAAVVEEKVVIRASSETALPILSSTPLSIASPASQQQPKKQPPPPPPVPPPQTKPPPPPSSGASRKVAQDYKKALADIAHLNSVNNTLKQRLEAAEKEIQAQHAELMTAATALKEERSLLKEEKDDFLAEHEEEMETLQQQQQDEIQKLHSTYQSQIKSLQEDLKAQREHNKKQGGDFAGEISRALEEKQKALDQVNALTIQQDQLKHQLDKMTVQQDALQQQCESLEQAAELARQAERQAEEKVDASLQHHKHQLAQRQARETDLEQMVSELGAALTTAQQQLQNAQNSSSANSGDTSDAASPSPQLLEYKEKYELAAEELETVQSEMRLTVQRCVALQREVQDLSAEQDAAVAQSQQRQREYDDKAAELTSKIRRLEGSLRETNRSSSVVTTGEGSSSDEARLRQVLREAEEARKHIASLSDQLIRQQGFAESSKSEVLALKGRLQAATARADAAEVALASATTASYDLEEGSASKSKRRIKGGMRALGVSRAGHLAPRSIRAALGIRVASGTAMEQVALTVDALDIWMLDTGSILKREPLARVIFAVYLTIIHCWCFALVFFHAVESEHGDLGALTHRGGALHPGRH